MSRSRTRRIAKWMGLVVCGVIAVTWAASLFWQGGGSAGTRGCFWFSQGVVWIASATWDIATDDGRQWTRIDFAPFWTPSFYANERDWFIRIPLWLPFVAVAIPTAWLWRRDRKQPPGHCWKCGYDLTGNVTGVCSECGENRLC